MTIKLDTFHGIAPRIHPTLLGEGMATTAHNVKLKSGKLVPLRKPSRAPAFTEYLENGLDADGKAKSLHIWRKYDGTVEFLMFPGTTWLANGNIADDKRTRVIVSGDTGATFTDGDLTVWQNTPVVYMRSSTADGDINNGEKSRVVICKNPLPKPEVTRIGGEPEDVTNYTLRGWKSVSDLNALTPLKGDIYTVTDEGTLTLGTLSVVEGAQVIFDGTDWKVYGTQSSQSIRYTRFCWTWVDAYGFESPASELSDEIKYYDGDSVGVVMPTEYVPQGAVLIRVYKVITGSASGNLQFVQEWNKTDTNNWMNNMSFDVKDENAGEVLTEMENPFPDTKCIQYVPGSYYVGFSPTHRKTVCFSEINMPYSWPVAYRYDVADNIVALAVSSNSVFVLTEGCPYAVSGTEPGGMSVAKLASPAACVSERGVCVYQNVVYFVSNAGLMAIQNSSESGTVCVNLTEKYVTEDQWKSLNPSSCVMCQHQGRLLLTFSPTATTRMNIAIDLDEQQDAISTHNETIQCGVVDDKTDDLYYVRGGV
ncbi:MAG: hypothetical protein J6V72_12115 [Kiritimatiellae bacterium]|nr:hypothetical protein [Kiritimatiellia bacterium]